MSNHTAGFLGAPDVEGCDVSGLLTALASVPDPRKLRGRMFSLVHLLSVALVAVLAGAKTFRSIGDHVADMSDLLLHRLGGRWCFFLGRYLRPSERTIRRVLAAVDADELDRVAGSWLLKNARRASDGALLLAIDGKVLRGSWTDEKERFTLFSAVLHAMGVTVAQVAVPAGTNEITQVESLLDAVPVGAGEQVVVTADAAHTQRETATLIKDVRGFDYYLTVKGNQPTLLNAVFERVSPLLRNTADHVVTERRRGRISTWETWVAEDAGDIDFPGIARIGCIRRRVRTLTGECVRKEYAWVITSNAAASAADLHTRIREHWTIENKSHYVRDVTYREDAHQAYVGNEARAMATLRNMAIGQMRIKGVNKITETTEWIARDQHRALLVLAT